MAWAAGSVVKWRSSKNLLILFLKAKSYLYCQIVALITFWLLLFKKCHFWLQGLSTVHFGSSRTCASCSPRRPHGVRSTGI